MKRIVLLAVVAMLAITPASADVNFGAYARSIAMGGAGLALIDDPIETGAINPAAYALNDKPMRFMFPSFDFRTEGASLSRILDVTSEMKDASGENAVVLARELGKQDTLAEMGAYAGVAVGPLVVTADGQADVSLIPGEGYKAWANAGAIPDISRYAQFIDPDSGVVIDQAGASAQLAQDGYTATVHGQAVYAFPSVAGGWTSRKNPAWHFGARVKMLHSKAVQEVVVPTGLDSSLRPTFDTDPAQSRNVSDSGMGADFGVIYRTPNPKLQITTAMVVNNLLKPNLDGVEMDAMLSAGAAVKLSNKLTVAGDLVNINGAYSENMKVRLGAEVAPLSWFAVRAGYGDSNLTFGLGVMGYNIAVSKGTPVVVGRRWAF